MVFAHFNFRFSRKKKGRSILKWIITNIEPNEFVPENFGESNFDFVGFEILTAHNLVECDAAYYGGSLRTFQKYCLSL
jgi:hypothetical protein